MRSAVIRGSVGLALLAASSHALAQVFAVPYANDFDEPADTLFWSHYAISGTDDWSRRDPAGFTDTVAHSEPFVWQTREGNDMAENSDRALQTPWFDLSDTTENMILSFWNRRKSTPSTAEWWLEYAVGQGGWSVLYDGTMDQDEWQDPDGFQGAQSTYTRSGISLMFLQGPDADSVRFRFRFVSGSEYGPGWLIDDFVIKPGIYDVVATRGDTIYDLHTFFTGFTTLSDYVFTNEFNNQFELQNEFYLSVDTILDQGDAFLAEVPVTVWWTENDWTCEVPMLPGLATGTYYVMHALNTQDPFRESDRSDNVSYSVLLLDSLFIADYVESFDSGEQYWNTRYHPFESEWRHGDPDDWGWHDPHSGNTAWYPVPLTSSGFGQNEYLESPYVDLSNTTDASLCFWFKDRRPYPGTTGAKFRFGATTPMLHGLPVFSGATVDVPYPRTDGWDCFCADMSAYDGISSTKVHFECHGTIGLTGLGGIIIDDVFMGSRACDLSVEGELDDRFTLGSRSTDTLFLQITNSGLLPSPACEMALYWSTDSVLNGGDQPLGTYSLPAIPDTTHRFLPFVYTKPTSQAGQFWIIAEIDPSDAVHEMREYNDRQPIRIFQYADAPLPYFNDFESETNGWRHDATLGHDEWAWAIPQKDTIDAAFSGVKAWVTNDTGIVSGHSRMHLYSPVFDLTQVERPVIEFDMWAWFYGMNNYSLWPYNGGNIKYSIDGGATWHILFPTDWSFSRWIKEVMFSGGAPTDQSTLGSPTGQYEVFETKQEPCLLGTRNFQGRDYDENHHFLLHMDTIATARAVQFKFTYANHNAPVEGLLMDNFSIAPGVADLRMAYSKDLWADAQDSLVEFNFDVKNHGNLSAADFDVHFYLSSDSVLDGGDTFLVSKHIDMVRPKAKGHRTVRVPAPDGYGDNEYLLYRIDPSNVIAELEEADNNGHWHLRIQEDVPLPYTNDFSAPVIDGWAWYNDSSGWGYEGIRFRTKRVAFDVLSSEVNDMWFLDPVNPTGISQPPNAYPRWYLCTPPFDLTYAGNIRMSFDLLSMGFEDQFDEDEGGNVEYSIDGGHSWAVLTESQDPNALNWYNDTSIYTIYGQAGWAEEHGDMDPRSMNLSWLSGQSNVRFRFQHKSSSTDLYPLTSGLRLDNFSLTGESVEMEAVDHEATITAGLESPSFTITYHVANNGVGEALPSTTRFYWSTDDILDPSDAVLYDFPEPVVHGHDTIALTRTIVRPEGVGQGVYHMFHITDADSLFHELDEVDNVAHWTITFIGDPGPAQTMCDPLTWQFHEEYGGSHRLRVDSQDRITLSNSSGTIYMYDTDGSELFVEPIPGSYWLHDMDQDAAGNIYAVGAWDAQLLDGCGLMHVDQSPSDYDLYVFKISQGGQCVWSTVSSIEDVWNNVGDDQGYSISISETGALYITGKNQGYFTLDSMDLSVPSSTLKTFVAKMDPVDGSFLSAVQHQHQQSFARVQALSDGGYFLYGTLAAYIDLSPDTAIYADPYYSGQVSEQSIYVARYDGAHNYMWHRTLSGECGLAASFDRGDTLFILGAMEDSVMVDGDTLMYMNGRSFFVYGITGDGSWSVLHAVATASEPDELIAGTSGLFVDDHGYLITGKSNADVNMNGLHSTNDSGGEEYFTVAYDRSFGPLWVNSYGDYDSYSRDALGAVRRSDGSVIAGADFANAITVDGFPFTGGNVSWFLVQMDGATGELCGFPTMIEASTTRTWSAFPNPTSSEVYLERSTPWPGDARVEVFTPDGRTCPVRSTVQSARITVDLSRLAPGAHMVRVLCGDEVRGVMIVKQ